MNVSSEKIKKISNIISPVLNEIPMIYSYDLSRRFYSNIFIKPENLQRTGSFKIRGAYYKASQLKDVKNGIIIGPFYNFGYAFSYVGSKFNIPIYIVFPKGYQYNFDVLRGYGAKIIEHGESCTEALQKAKELQEEKGLLYLNPHEDLNIILAYGTIALEMLRDEKSLEILAVPVKYGTLISGISIFAKEILPQVKIIGVYKEDSIYLNDITKEIIEKYVDELVSVDKDVIREAVRLYIKDTKMVVEESASYPLAALLKGEIKTKNKSIGLILSGGNIPLRDLKEIL